MRSWMVRTASSIWGLLFLLPLSSCDSSRFSLLQFGIESDNAAEREGAETVEYIEQYTDDIRKHRKELQSAVQAAGRIAHFNKLLAIEYLKVGMFGLALESLEEALLIEPTNEVLFYLSGISAMQLARANLRQTSRHTQLLHTAEHAFQRSLELKDDYSDSLFAISLLYIFDQETPDRARPYLERLRVIERSSPHVHALLGRVQVENGDLAGAVQSYQRAADLYTEAEYRQKALDNIAEIETRRRGGGG